MGEEIIKAYSGDNVRNIIDFINHNRISQNKIVSIIFENTTNRYIVIYYAKKNNGRDTEE